MQHDHKLTYIDLHPQPIKPRREWLQDICAALMCAQSTLAANYPAVYEANIE